MRYLLSIDYEEGNTKSYRGVVIDDSSVTPWIELVRVNTGSPQLDEKRALRQLRKLIKDADVYYMSSYDNYFMDFDYETDPVYRADVDAIQKEQDEKIDAYKKEIGKSEDDELTIEEFNYIINRRDI